MIARTFSIAILMGLFQSCSAQPPEKDSVETYAPIPSSNKAVYAAEIEKQYKQLLGNRGFNGSILVAKNGEILFEDYQGFSNFKTKERIAPNTPFHLASVSKTFTGMAIMKLREQGKLNLDDMVTDFFPSFPYSGITVQLLLNHRSGLNNYVYFLVDKKVETYRVKTKKGRWVRRKRIIKMPALKPGLLTNQDMLDYMVQYKPAPLFAPDRAFRYSNTNYALLALIIEKVTGQSYPTYMKDSLFTPLGMTDSYVFGLADTANYIPSYKNNNVPYGIEKLDCIYGDKNVYSTVRDLFLWDRALHEGTYVSQTSQTLAYQPYSFETTSFHNYGLGWRLLNSPTEEIVYHNGWWHGNNTVFTRYIKDTATIIVLGNRYNRNIYKAKKLSSAFTGRTDSTELEE
ncbi:MAG TPA: serine hydrolase [Chitinophagaceae bacterium]|nr:serine hydrolase [Chitinophagaceae bacterium]